MQQPAIIKGGTHTDHRGILSHVNGFDMQEIKRFYFIEHPSTSVIRAWQGHKMEKKWFFVTKGSFLVKTIKVDDWENPSDKPDSAEFILSNSESEILYIPGGYANGFKAMEDNSGMIVFSNFTIEESAADNYRFEKEKWNRWV